MPRGWKKKTWKKSGEPYREYLTSIGEAYVEEDLQRTWARIFRISRSGRTYNASHLSNTLSQSVSHPVAYSVVSSCVMHHMLRLSEFSVSRSSTEPFANGNKNKSQSRFLDSTSSRINRILQLLYNVSKQMCRYVYIKERKKITVKMMASKSSILWLSSKPRAPKGTRMCLWEGCPP